MRTIQGAAAALAAVMAVVCGAPGSVGASPQYAALVMDARTGEVLHSRNADTRLHPASLTKMMTLYLTFEAVGAGRLDLDQKILISSHVARQPASKMGYRKGERVSVRHLIRATAIKSANDAAEALGEAVSGSQRAFAAAMTARARQLGLTRTTFKNASGLTAPGHLSTARDMARLGRALFFDFPQYYHLFGRVSHHASGRKIWATNRRLLRGYRGADGIKTGYTRAAGFNLVSSARRGGEHVIAAVFGGKSVAWRTARIAELMDLGFKRMPSRARVRRHATVRVARAPTPRPRPGAPASAASELIAAAGAALVPAARASAGSLAAPPASPREALIPQPRPAQADNVEWAVQIGVYSERASAVAQLASTALGDVRGLDTAGRQVSKTPYGDGVAWRARLTGLDEVGALAACAELEDRGRDCLPLVADH